MDIDDPAVWHLLMSPVRVEIAEGLRCLGPCSVAELAELIDRPADTLYRHLQLLQDAGLVVAAGFRKGPRNTEQLVDVAAEDFRPVFDPASGETASDAILHMARTFLKCADRAIRDVADARAFNFTNTPQRNVIMNYELGWLTADDVAELRALVDRMKAIMDAGKRTRQGRPFLLLNILTEVIRKRPAKRRRAEKPERSGNQTSPPHE